MSSCGVLAGAVGVGEEGAVDGFGELSFQESEGFVAAVAGVASALVVVASGAWADGLGVGGEVDGVVELLDYGILRSHHSGTSAGAFRCVL